MTVWVDKKVAEEQAGLCDSPAVKFDIREYVGADLLDPVTRFLHSDARKWCEEVLSGFVEHKTGRPEVPLVIYFTSEAEKAAFSKRWL